MKFSLFHKDKQQEPEKPAVPPQEEPKQETAVAPSEEPKQEPTPPAETQPTEPEPAETPAVAPEPEKKPEAAEPASKTYLKAMPLKNLSDVENVKDEIRKGNIVILRVTPLATKSIDDVKNAVNDLFQFAEEVGGDIARLGEERVVICPKNIRIWREKTPAQSSSLPTAPTTAA